jgi:hypothetical protein
MLWKAIATDCGMPYVWILQNSCVKYQVVYLRGLKRHNSSCKRLKSRSAFHEYQTRLATDIYARFRRDIAFTKLASARRRLRASQPPKFRSLVWVSYGCNDLVSAIEQLSDELEANPSRRTDNAPRGHGDVDGQGGRSRKSTWKCKKVELREGKCILEPEIQRKKYHTYRNDHREDGR